MSRFDLSTSQALWIRERLDLRSDEVLAQIMDRGELDAWRELYRLASGHSEEAAELRRRILRMTSPERCPGKDGSPRPQQRLA